MADVTLNATTRTEFGKGAARRLRRDGQTPAVLYGHGTDPVHLALPAQETFLALRAANVLLEIVVDGGKLYNVPLSALYSQADSVTGPLVTKLPKADLSVRAAGAAEAR